MDRIIVAFRGEETRRRILRLLALEGREGVPCAGGAEALRAVRRLGGGVVICGFYLSDMTANALAEDLRGLALVLVAAQAACLELCGGENLYKLAVPVSPPEFAATLRLLLDRAPAPRPASRRNEADQALIRRAKALLMDVNRMSEEDAHRFLRRRAMDGGMKLEEAARRIIESYGM
nr:ANTAR domain-containing protein [uncultured Oscillibacter sp.]